MEREKFAKLLLEIEALRLSPEKPFKWTSGILSPIYCDNRLIISYPHARDLVAQGLCKIIKESFPKVEIIAATATAGIPHGTLVADRLRLPMVYVRSSPKGHGLGNVIEGRLTPGQKTVVVEDLISTGKSSIATVDAIKKNKGEVLGVVAIFTYQFEKTNELFKTLEIPIFTLTDYFSILDLGIKKGTINHKEERILKEWSKNPDKWQGLTFKSD